MPPPRGEKSKEEKCHGPWHEHSNLSTPGNVRWKSWAAQLSRRGDSGTLTDPQLEGGVQE